MKIDRLIGILAVLLQQENSTAPVLAEKFEVSRRTINRDIDALCQAGIPIVTRQGVNGGISIMEGYKLDKTLLTKSDLQSIMAGLKGLDSVAANQTYKQLMEKLSLPEDEVLRSNEHIMIDLASWYQSSLAPKIELLQTAIEHQERVRFFYYSPRGESERTAEPYQLIFKWSSWYLWAYCVEKKEFRLFKLNRMDALKNTMEIYEKRQMPYPNLETERIFPAKYPVKILFEPQAKWRLIEEYGRGCFTEQENGQLLFSFEFTDKKNLFEWLLTFAGQAELLEPVALRGELQNLAMEIYKRYEKT